MLLHLTVAYMFHAAIPPCPPVPPDSHQSSTTLVPFPCNPRDDDTTATLASVGKGRLLCPSLGIPNGGSVCIIKLTYLKMTNAECSKSFKSTPSILGPWKVPLCLVSNVGLSANVCLPSSPFGADLQCVSFL